jgi:hypothetical protein
MRARLALLVGVLCGGSLLTAAAAAARPHPEAYAATIQYLRSATQSCVKQAPTPGGFCTQLNTFTVTMTVLATNRYRIEVADMRHANFPFFAWLPADGMTLRRIASVRNGDCGISGGMITCWRTSARGAGVQPDLIVDFTATGLAPKRAKGGYWIHFGLVTPYLDVPTFNDVPICDTGQTSTEQHPCLK